MIHPLTASKPRFGMTLIELLVVVAILGLLSVVVLPSFSGNEEARSGRAAAEQVAALINQARNDAMGTGRPAGVTIRPVSTGAAAAIDLFRCRVPPEYRGDTAPATLRFTGFPSPVLTGTGGCIANMKSAGVSAGDLIILNDRKPAFEIVSVPEPNGTQFEIAVRSSNAGQTTTNTPWPPENVPMTFAIERQPRVVGSPLSLGQSRCLDLAWSGFTGTSGFDVFGAGSTVAITFDARGQVSQVVRNGVRETIQGPVFLLIGRTDRVTNEDDSGAGPSAFDDSIGANWQYPTSYWIAIDPASGQVRTAECTPNALVPEDSREWARKALVSQGM